MTAPNVAATCANAVNWPEAFMFVGLAVCAVLFFVGGIWAANR
jgi:hypothetical protein